MKAIRRGKCVVRTDDEMSPKFGVENKEIGLMISCKEYHIYPTTPLGQDMTQG